MEIVQEMLAMTFSLLGSFHQHIVKHIFFHFIAVNFTRTNVKIIQVIISKGLEICGFIS